MHTILSVRVPLVHPSSARMCTMDYVHEILTKQGWERCICINDYMAGWETSPDEPDDDEVVWLRPTNPETACKGCQTPQEWAVCGLAQERKEAEPGRAAPRKRALQPGTTTPHLRIGTARAPWCAPSPNSHTRRYACPQMSPRRKSPRLHQKSGAYRARPRWVLPRSSSWPCCSAKLLLA